MRIKFLVLLSTVLILHHLIPSARAQDLGLESIAPTAGVTYAPENKEPGFIAGLVTNFGEISKNIEIYPGLFYLYAEKDAHSRSAFQLSLDAKYFFSPRSGLYAGGGLSLNHTSEKIAADSRQKREFQPGGALLMGTELFAEHYIWFLQIKLDVIDDYKMIGLSTGFFFDIYR